MAGNVLPSRRAPKECHAAEIVPIYEGFVTRWEPGQNLWVFDRKSCSKNEVKPCFQQRSWAFPRISDVPSAVRNHATTLDNFGTLYLVYGRLEEAERYNRLGPKIREKMKYPLDLSRSEQHLAEIDLAKHRFKQAKSEAAGALVIMHAENDPDPLDRIAALNALAFTRCLRGRCVQGMEDAQHAFDLARSNFRADSMAVARAQMAVGFATWKSGRA